MYVGALAQLTTALPALLPIMLLLVCVGLGFFVVHVRKRATWAEDEASGVRRRNMTVLACIGVDLLVIAYVGVAFFLFQFLVDHVDLLR